MTASGPSQGEDPGPQQEGIWEASDGAADEATEGPAAGGLTSRLTSTSRTPGPAGLVLADVPNRIMALILDVIVLSVIGFALAWLFGGLVSEPGALDASGGELDIVAFLLVVVLQLRWEELRGRGPTARIS